MDGTLVDSLRYWRQLSTEYLTGKGVVNLPPDLFEQIKPLTMAQSAALFFDRYKPAPSAEAVADEMNELMNEHYRRDIPLKDGVREYLSALRNRGVRMCVASATGEPLMEQCLTRLGIREYFEFLLSCETIGKGKTEPDIYYEAARRLGCKPDEAVVYEDAYYALKTAKAAGFFTIGVYETTSAERHWDKVRLLADEVVQSFDGLTSVI